MNEAGSIRLAPLPALSILLLCLLFTLPGCGGCSMSGSGESLSREELEKRRREQQDALVANELISLPTDSQRAIVSLKPGHWVETTQRFKSTREDLQVMAVGSVHRGNERVTLPASNFVNEFSRRTVLPKGQEKSIGLQYFVPPAATSQQSDQFPHLEQPKRLALGTELVAVPLMTPIAGSAKRSSVNELKENEFQLMVLSPQSLAYQYLAGLDAVYWAISDGNLSNSRVRSYEVCLVSPKDNQYEIPHSFLTMTSVAVIVWDDVSISDLSADQQRAIIDWLHWGGQLIISGPTSWSRLQDSFLSPYLPALTADSVELNTESFAEMSRTWVTTDVGKLKTTEPIQIIGPPVTGLKMKLNERGSWLPGTAELVAESRVGRGRIAVTGFPLRESRIYRWPYYSSFFSTGLLRRWPRSVRRTGTMGEAAQSWIAPFTADDFDPRMHSNVRILSRDLAKLTRESPVDESPDADESIAVVNGEHLRKERVHEPWNWGGAAAWSDYAGMSDDAVEALRAAAGIELPSRSTILKLLGGYLICLVPLNYLIFRLLRRLEFAWIAAPVMAIIAVVVVTRVAQLDIGFARRTIDIGVLELHEGHSRGHLTQYVALYTSLSTNYSIEFPETDSAALPLSDVRRETRRSQMAPRLLQTNFGRADGVVLEPLTVYSNSTEMLRAEQMVPLTRPIRLQMTDTGDHQLANLSELKIRDCLMLRKNEAGQLESAWMGFVDAGQVKSVSWKSSTIESALSNWEGELQTSSRQPSAQELTSMQGIWVGGLLNRVARRVPLMPGSTVLIGQTQTQLGSLKILPAQDQYDESCLIVAHLSAADFGAVQPDTNIISRGETQDNETETKPPQ